MSVVTGLCYESPSLEYLIYCIKGNRDEVQIGNFLRGLMPVYIGSQCLNLGYFPFTHYGAPENHCPDATMPGVCVFTNENGMEHIASLVNASGGDIEVLNAKVIKQAFGYDNRCGKADFSMTSPFFF
jgi:hypothetical protein